MKRLRLTSKSCAKSGQFREGSGHECSLGVVTQGEAIANPSGDGEDVFQCATQFDSDDIVVGISAKRIIAENFLKLITDEWI